MRPLPLVSFSLGAVVICSEGDGLLAGVLPSSLRLLSLLPPPPWGLGATMGFKLAAVLIFAKYYASLSLSVFPPPLSG